MQSTCSSLFNRDNLALYRYQRYQQSLSSNGNFYFGPKSVLLFGAASFLYEVFPSGGDAGTPDLPTIASFFGTGVDAPYGSNNEERIPEGWYNRKEPYSNTDVTVEIAAQYLEHPVLFGGNTGSPDSFDAIDFAPSISAGNLDTSEKGILCLIYQLATENVPSSLSGVLELPLEVVQVRLHLLWESFVVGS